MELLTIKQLSLSVGNKQLVDSGSFSVFPGDVILLTGPNGCGKSTIIKFLLGATFEYKDLACSALTVRYKEEYDILNDEGSNELFRQNICYVSQEDEFESESILDCFINSIDSFVANEKEEYVFEFIKRFSIQKCFGLQGNGYHLNRNSKKLCQVLGLDRDQLSEEDASILAFLSMSTKKMSGGQRRLANIFTNLIRYQFCDLLLLDEPLNNLDYNNVRAFSNILTQVYHSKPDLGIILVTHCRSIPIVNRMISIDVVSKAFREDAKYICSSCFGVVDDSGLYQDI